MDQPTAERELTTLLNSSYEGRPQYYSEQDIERVQNTKKRAPTKTQTKNETCCLCIPIKVGMSMLCILSYFQFFYLLFQTYALYYRAQEAEVAVYDI